ncbi:hypothetical protein [Paludibacterium paludis]|nr:hypothetical protein [Paludibacterium paludis]
MACLASLAFADGQSDCDAAAGTYLTGTIVKAPTFKPGSRLKGVELSHTHLALTADQDGQTYDVAIDNVFADGYDKARGRIPPPLDTLRVDDRLELCGQPYTTGIGIHWVHTNCGDPPTPSKPNGWVKKLNADGSVSANYEGNTEYCHLWQ